MLIPSVSSETPDEASISRFHSSIDFNHIPYFYDYINPKPKTASKQRNTLSKQIKALAASDIRTAIQLAEYGYKLAPLEARLFLYLGDRTECVEMKSGKAPIWAAAMPKKMADREKRLSLQCYERDREWFSRELLNAIDTMDAEKFFEYGRSIERFRNARTTDPVRRALLICKWVLKKSGGTMTIREVAELIGWHDMNPPDGFSQLRKVCRELKFPLGPSRQTRKR